MRLCWKGLLSAIFFGAFLLTMSAAGFAASCTTQAELTPQDRGALAAVGERLSTAFVQQDLGALQSALLPAMASQWNGIQGVAEQAAPLVKGGKTQLRSIYLLDASTSSAPSDTQFFCSSANGAPIRDSEYALAAAREMRACAGRRSWCAARVLKRCHFAWDRRFAPEWKLGGAVGTPGNLRWT